GDQIVDSGDEVGPEAIPWETSVATLPPPANRLAPAEDLLDPLPSALAQRIARMASRAAIEVRAPARGDVLGHMWGDSLSPHRFDEGGGVVRLVRPQRLRMKAIGPLPPPQPQGFVALGTAGRPCDADVDAQPVAVLHQHVEGEGQLRLLPLALPREERVQVRERPVGGVR